MLTLYLTDPPNAAVTLSAINSLVYVLVFASAVHMLTTYSCDIDVNSGQMCGQVCADQPTVSINLAYAEQVRSNVVSSAATSAMPTQEQVSSSTGSRHTLRIC